MKRRRLEIRATRRSGRSIRTGRLARSVMLWGLIVLVLAVTGCLPTRKARSTTASTNPETQPQVPETATVSVDLTRASDSTEFRRHPTTDQTIKVHLDFGRVFEAQGNHEAALLEYQDALVACERRGVGRTRSEAESLAHRRIGGSLDRLGRFAQAEVHYKKALKLSPRDPKVWNDAGYSYYLQGRWADAERALKTAGRLAPEDARIKTNLGLTLAAAGRTSEAFALLGQFSGDATAHANLGFLLAATGQLDLAKQQYEQALARRPDLELARRALARIDLTQRGGQAETVARKPGLPRLPASTAPLDPGVIQTSADSTRIPPPRIYSASTPQVPSRSLPPGQSRPLETTTRP